MSDVVSYELVDNIAVISVNTPPVNALSQAVREGILDAVTTAQGDASEAIILHCEGRTFIAGADITEFGKPPQEPGLPSVLSAIENSSKPVIAAIHGTALGGGFEVALACHYRCAIASAKVGLPEVKLGLLPGAGGTQRLPRLVGAQKALEMIVGGNPIKAAEARELGLVDEVVSGDLLEGALAFARKLVADGAPLRKISELGVPGDTSAELFEHFEQSIARKQRGFKAPFSCIKAVKAAVELPYDKGVERERELFFKLLVSSESAAQRHVFFAEREVAKVPGLDKDTPKREIKQAAVIGAGTMGGGIAMNFANAGIPVKILEVKEEALEKGIAIIRKNYENTAKKGRITQQQVEQRMALIQPTLSYDDLSDVDLVIEAVFENMDVKKAVFSELDRVCKPGAILATNTSTLDVNRIASFTRRPEDVMGMHFFSPANVMKLLEVVRGENTRDDVLATAMKLSKKIGKVAAVSGVCPGFIGNRMLSKRQEQANQLILEGANYWDVDDVLLEFGFPMGPFQMGDLAGIDIGWHRDPSKVTTIREALCAVGRFGQKAGKGFYDYDEARQRTPSDEVKQIIADFAEKEGNEQRDISKDEIRERLLYPMVNEGAKILGEGMAQRASDIDVVWINGYGWPLYTGGPMFWADTIGLDTVVTGLEKHGLPVSDYLRKKAEAGESFN